MWILKTYTNHPQHYVECEYKSEYPTYWFKEMEMDMWRLNMSKKIKMYIPIGYVYENT